MKQDPVLVVGAGPTGLLFSHWLHKYGVPHRIVDKAKGPGETSRAIVMHARTLEFYRMLGLDQLVLDAGTIVTQMNIRKDGQRKGGVEFANSGLGQSKHPFVLSITQDEHEEILQRKLEEKGVKVERGVEVVNVDLPCPDDNEKCIAVTLRSTNEGEDEVFQASYLIGCDGAHSIVRDATGIEMEGGTYDRSFFVADIHCHGAMQTQGHLNICLTKDEFFVMIPLPRHANRARVTGVVPQECDHKDATTIDFEDCRPVISRNAPGMIVDKVNWFARYKAHHRCAANFQYGNRVFLCGDAAHLHSPVGGQGMNTGLGDATNLAWKIATVWHAAAAATSTSEITFAHELLSTYNVERRRFAYSLVQSNDKMFKTMVSKDWNGWLLRNVMMPYIAPMMMYFFDMGGNAFKGVSQIGIEYAPSSLSQGDGNLPGWRLPYIEEAGGDADKGDNHAMLDGMRWSAHVFAQIPADVEETLKRSKIPLYTFPWSPELGKKGFVEGALYLVRPDGYIGLVLTNNGEAEKVLGGYLDRWAVGCMNASS